MMVVLKYSSPDGEIRSRITTAETNADGVYAALGLTPGSYFASTRAFSSELLDELYDDLPCPGGAPQGCDPTAGTPIVVPPDEVLTDVDFALGPGGQVSGRVRDASTGLPLEGIQVRVFNSNGEQIGDDLTDVAGRYTVAGLGDGAVFALAGGSFSDFQLELYQEIPCLGSCNVTTGTPIPVTVGTTISGIDFSLERLGAISGMVTRAVGGDPVAFEGVDLWNDQGSFVDSGSTDATGAYRIGGLAAGTYFATTDTFGEYIDELYDDLPCFPSCEPTMGTPIPVSLGAETGGIDFALNRLGTISGTLTDAVSGAPLFVNVVVYDASGVAVASVFGFGSYEIVGLDPGSHFVIASANLYQSELYDDLPCPGGPPVGCDPTSGTPVPVALDTDATGIDFALTPVGAISGAVTESGTGLPLDDLFLQLWDAVGRSGGDENTRSVEDLSGPLLLSGRRGDLVCQRQPSRLRGPAL